MQLAMVKASYRPSLMHSTCYSMLIVTACCLISLSRRL